MSADRTLQCDRHQLAHTAAFYRALAKLQELQATRRRQELAGSAPIPPPPFADEAACEHYLAGRLCSGKYFCGRCGAAKGYYLPARRS